MIKDYEYLHGVVFSKIFSVFDQDISIKPYKKGGYSSFIINNCAGLYIKYCSNRLSPWRFSFTNAHQEEIKELAGSYTEVFTAFVCNLDGVVMLNLKELKILLDDIHQDHEWVSISRQKNKMYTVSASDGKLDFKIGKTSCPNKIIDYLSSR